jgi:ABC-type uncharacterized transport system involved in gliding motility auxiliary subunit
MNSDSKRFAYLGLVLSGIALLALIVLIFLKALDYAGLFTPPDPELINRLIYLSGGIIVIGIAAYAILDPDKVRNMISGRQMKYGSNSLIMLIAFSGILIVANMIAYQSELRWDVTEDQERTLAPESIDTMKALPEPVFAKAFYSGNASPEYTRQLLEDFKAASDGKFDFEFIDPETNPIAAQEAEITSDATVVLSMGAQREQITYPSEQDLTGAMVRLINPEERAVYFLTGHGERDIESSEETAYSRAGQTLESKNYTVSKLNLAATNQIPDNAKLIVIAGGIQPLTAGEIKLLDDYMANKGSLVIMFEPSALTDMKGQPNPLIEFARRWGIEVRDDFVIDPNANPASVSVADSYSDHPITNKLNGILSVYPTSRSLIEGIPNADVTLTPLVQTAATAWGESDPASIENETVSQDVSDNAGPLMLAMAAENAVTESRLVVFGDSEFAVDGLFDQYANGSMFINTVDWATGNEAVISLTPKDATARTFVPPGPLGTVGIFLFSCFVVPLAILGGGVAAWINNRKRG